MLKYAYSVQGNQDSEGHFLNSRSSKDVNDKDIISCVASIVYIK